MHRQHSRRDSEGIEQALAMPGILRRHDVDRGQNGQRANAYVIHVSERRRHHIQ